MGNPTEGREDSLHDGLVEAKPPTGEQIKRAMREVIAPTQSELEAGSRRAIAGAVLEKSEQDRWYQAQSAAFDNGLQIGAKTATDAARRAIAGAVLEILGKDRSDGPVDLGALGVWLAGGAPGLAAECYKPSLPSATVAMDAIADLLDGREWNVEDLETIADLVRHSGRPVRGPIVNGEQFAPGYTPEAAAYEQRNRG